MFESHLAVRSQPVRAETQDDAPNDARSNAKIRGATPPVQPAKSPIGKSPPLFTPMWLVVGDPRRGAFAKKSVWGSNGGSAA
jgi:hypothetical protein